MNNIKDINQEKKYLFFKKKKNLVIFSFFISKIFIYKSLFIIRYILKNKIKVIILINTCIIKYDIIDKKYNIMITGLYNYRVIRNLGI